MTRTSTIIATLTLLLLLVVAGQHAKAQSSEEWQEVEEINNSSLQLNQSYHGTRPGNGNTLPRVKELKDLPGAWVTWPGFVMLPNGGSRIFIQTTQALEYTKSESKKSKRLSFHFKDTQVHLSNNKNPLLTMHFNTPVKSTYLKRKNKKNVDLVLKFKVKATPVVTQISDQDGYHYMFIDFPAGQYQASDSKDTQPSSYSMQPTDGQTQITDNEAPPNSNNQPNP